MEPMISARRSWTGPVAALGLLLLLGCGAGCDGCRGQGGAPEPDRGAPGAAAGEAPAADSLDRIARDYVVLVFQLGAHDKDYVDAYFGPKELRQAADRAPLALDQIPGRAAMLAARLGGIAEAGLGEEQRARRRFLLGSVGALRARAELVGGKAFTFDQEARAIYGVSAPRHDEAYFGEILEQLQGLLPGKGPLARRYQDFRARYFVPAERLEAVFRAAVAEARRRTRARLALPEGETFALEFVRAKPWGAYNWYKGKAHSLIQVNTELPLTVGRALDLACHEGYPGHHTYHSRIEAEFVDKRGWVELSIYPLFSPMSVVSEGAANFAVELAFPDEQRLEFERDTLYPLAGLDPATAPRFHRVRELVQKLRPVSAVVARDLLDGAITDAQALERLTRWGLRTEKRAKMNLAFIRRYRAYIVNYSEGARLVAAAVERRAGPNAGAPLRWEVFGELISRPLLPADLR